MPERETGMTPAREHRGQLTRRGGSPFASMQWLADEFDRLLADFGLGRSWPSWSLGETGGMWAPDVDVVQKHDQFTVRVDLPGLKKDEISVEIADGALTLQGERKRDHEEEREGVYRRERSYGAFYRTIPLPEGAITEQAKASFKDGVLEVTMPAPPSGKGRRLEISESRSR